VQNIKAFKRLQRNLLRPRDIHLRLLPRLTSPCKPASIKRGQPPVPDPFLVRPRIMNDDAPDQLCSGVYSLFNFGISVSYGSGPSICSSILPVNIQAPCLLWLTSSLAISAPYPRMAQSRGLCHEVLPDVRPRFAKTGNTNNK